jgi:hypothetical protein
MLCTLQEYLTEQDLEELEACEEWVSTMVQLEEEEREALIAEALRCGSYSTVMRSAARILRKRRREDCKDAAGQGTSKASCVTKAGCIHQQTFAPVRSRVRSEADPQLVKAVEQRALQQAQGKKK